MNVSIIGLGCVGSAMRMSFEEKFKLSDTKILVYDKYKEIGNINDTLNSDFIFLCLPTLFKDGLGYDKSAIYETCDFLRKKNYSGLVILKSTVEPGTSKYLREKYFLDICHNPEFLSEKTAFLDFHNQKHIVIGKTSTSSKYISLYSLYSDLYPKASFSICDSFESEAMKIFCNSFYASKIMIFNEFYNLCSKMNIDYNKTVGLMVKNGWINEMHTKVPGTDGKMAYGGMCFPKDTNALKVLMEKNNIPNKVISAVIEERNNSRED